MRGRRNLLRGYHMNEARRGIGAPARKVMALLHKAAVVYQVVLTKIDKVKPGPLGKVQAATEAELKRHGAAYPEILATSSKNKIGLELLRATVATLAEEDRVSYMQGP